MTVTAHLAVDTTFTMKTSISRNLWGTWLDNFYVFSVPQRFFSVLASISSAINSVPRNKSIYLSIWLARLTAKKMPLFPFTVAADLGVSSSWLFRHFAFFSCCILIFKCLVYCWMLVWGVVIKIEFFIVNFVDLAVIWVE